MHALQSHSAPQAVGSALTDFALRYNCVYDNACAQWLRSEGAAWPAVLQYEGDAWSDEAVEWCRIEGCDSPEGPSQEELQEQALLEEVGELQQPQE
jgi:hypothetical protein